MAAIRALYALVLIGAFLLAFPSHVIANWWIVRAFEERHQDWEGRLPNARGDRSRR